MFLFSPPVRKYVDNKLIFLMLLVNWQHKIGSTLLVIFVAFS